MYVCTSQWYENVPALLAVNVFDPVAKRPASKLPSSALSSWSVPSWLVTVIVSPAFTVSGVGSNLKFWMVIVVPDAAAEDCDPPAAVDPLVVEAVDDDELVVDEPDPHPAYSVTSKATAAISKARWTNLFELTPSIRSTPLDRMRAFAAECRLGRLTRASRPFIS